MCCIKCKIELFKIIRSIQNSLDLMPFVFSLYRSSPPPHPRKAQESQKEMKLLLDMYRSAPKEQRDKVQLMAAEKKSKAEVTWSDVNCHSDRNLHLWDFPLQF